MEGGGSLLAAKAQLCGCQSSTSGWMTLLACFCALEEDSTGRKHLCLPLKQAGLQLLHCQMQLGPQRALSIKSCNVLADSGTLLKDGQVRLVHLPAKIV